MSFFTGLFGLLGVRLTSTREFINYEITFDHLVFSLIIDQYLLLSKELGICKQSLVNWRNFSFAGMFFRNCFCYGLF